MTNEPIAWMVYTLDGKSVCVTDNPADFTPEHRALPLYTSPQPCPTCEALARTVMLDQTSHDAQRKPLVGLTDQEIVDLWTDTALKFDGSGWHAIGKQFARAIEAKLREKNS